jgi:hypothetical protein
MEITIKLVKKWGQMGDKWGRGLIVREDKWGRGLIVRK